MSADGASGSAPGSPKSRLKFLCSHGGKILPRPFDGHLKYVGGETRVISVHRGILFQELMKRLNYPSDGEMTLKYQVVSEDLDALVTVRSEEDLRHMLDEIERYEKSGGPRLRAFLFPTDPVVVMDNPIGSSVDPRALEQRYIDAVNGIIRPAPNPIRLHPTIMNAMHHGSVVSSACSSPRSPDSCTTEPINHNEQNNYCNNNIGRSNMHRVRSLPSICSLNGFPQQQQQNNQYNQHVPNQYVQYPVFQSPRLPIDPQKSVGPERLIHVRSVGQTEGVRYQMDPLPSQYYTCGGVSSRQGRGNGVVHYEECGHLFDRRVTERNGNLATSPVLASPLGQVGKTWDTKMHANF